MPVRTLPARLAPNAWGVRSVRHTPDTTAPPDGRALAGRAVVAAGLRGAQAGLTFAALLLAAHWLGGAAYGRFAVALAWLNLVAVLAALGLPTLLLRLGAVTRGAGQWGPRRGLLRRSLQAPAVVVLAAVGLTAAARRAGLLDGLDGAAGLLPLAAALALPLAWLRVLGSWLLAQGRTLAGHLGEAVLRPALFLAALGAAAGAGAPGSGRDALLLLAGASLAALAVVASIVWNTERCHPKAPATDAWRDWARAARPLLGVAVLHAVMANVDVLMLGALDGAAAAGGYHLAARVAQLAGLLLLAVNGVLGPVLARRLAAGDTTAAARLASGSARAVTLVALAALAVAAVLGTAGAAWVHPALGAARPALLILLAAQVANAACGPVALLLNMAGRERAAALGLGLGALANVALNAVLIPAHGTVGAALATGASLVLWNLVLLWQVRRRLGLDPSALGRGVPRRPA